MAIELNEAQLKAVYQLRNGCILCGGVGTGKSRTALAYYYICNGGRVGKNSAPMKKHPQDLYVITTARKRDDMEWEPEMSGFLMMPGKSFYDHNVVIDSWNNIKKYVNVSGAFFIFDEQRVVGKGTWARSFQKIAKKNNWILLSATPGDTWQDYMQVFIANGFFRNQQEFYNNHVIWEPRVKFPKISGYYNVGRLMRLRDQILVDIEVEKMTEQVHVKVLVDYDHIMYKDMMKNRWDIKNNKPFENAAGLCYGLREIVNSDPSRIEELLDIFRTHKRLIVFYNFDYERNILLSIDFGVEVAEWSGHAHQPVPDGDSWVYLVQYTAGAEGWNCIKTDTIVFWSQNYSYKVMTQACGRIDRMNTSYKTLYYYYFVSRANIDLAISRALKEKKNFNETRFISRYDKQERSKST